tara:strand:- start:685 stop:924 length:240 start_codon:yes stop_codon:yes gene_type:complete
MIIRSSGRRREKDDKIWDKNIFGSSAGALSMIGEPMCVMHLWLSAQASVTVVVSFLPPAECTEVYSQVYLCIPPRFLIL